MAGNDGQAVGEGMVDGKPDIAWDDYRVAYPEYSAQRIGVVHLPRKMAPGCAACQRPQLRFLRPAADNQDLDQRAMLGPQFLHRLDQNAHPFGSFKTSDEEKNHGVGGQTQFMSEDGAVQ